MPRLEGRVALISGGARGQGAVEARMFAGEGAKVVIGDILDAEGQQVEAEINEGGGECVYVRLDVTSEVDWQQAVETAVGRFGKLDVLVNNAGIGSPRGPDGERVLIETLTEDQWDRTLDVNAKGVFWAPKRPSLRCARRAAALSLTSRRWLDWSAGPPQPTARQKELFVCSRRRLPFSTPGKVYAPTPCIPVSSSPP